MHFRARFLGTGRPPVPQFCQNASPGSFEIPAGRSEPLFHAVSKRAPYVARTADPGRRQFGEPVPCRNLRTGCELASPGVVRIRGMLFGLLYLGAVRMFGWLPQLARRVLDCRQTLRPAPRGRRAPSPGRPAAADLAGPGGAFRPDPDAARPLWKPSHRHPQPLLAWHRRLITSI